MREKKRSDKLAAAAPTAAATAAIAATAAAAADTAAADTAAARQHTHLRHGEPHHSDTEALATTVVALVIGQSLFVGWFVAPLGSTTLSMNDWTARKKVGLLLHSEAPLSQ